MEIDEVEKTEVEGHVFHPIRSSQLFLTIDVSWVLPDSFVILETGGSSSFWNGNGTGERATIGTSK